MKKEEIYLSQDDMSGKKPQNDKKKKIIMVLIVLLVLVGGWLALRAGKNSRKGQPIEINNDKKIDQPVLNEGPVSPISGISCENWNRRPLAVMQPADVDARPAAGFSEADMVVEMPVITASITRLMAVYICNLPKEVGSMRSARHDFIHLAAGLDAIFVPWGRSVSHSDSDKFGLAKGVLDSGVVDNINCNADAGVSVNKCSDPTSVCFRKTGMARGVDSGYGKPEGMLKCAEELGYRMESNFSGYPHQAEASLEERPEKGDLRVGYAGAYGVNYEYNKEKNHYRRVWNKKIDTDRNNGNEITPKNIAVLMASSEQIEGQYNNLQLGDPWYDSSDSGDAYYYFNGKEQKGTWKKDKSKIDSKLTFLDSSGKEVAFVPGQIWVNVLEPGQSLKWRVNEEVEE